MKYYAIRIDPSVNGKFWEFSITKVDQQEREDGRQHVTSLGIGYFYEHTPVEEAFKMLKDKMLETHQEKIDNLIKSRNLLSTLTLEN